MEYMIDMGRLHATFSVVVYFNTLHVVDEQIKKGLF